jgi:iron(III) transport system substrate-binding protein
MNSLNRYVWFLGLVLCVSIPGITLAGDNLSELMRQAKEEGTVTFYSVTNPTAMTPILNRFREKYPFLTVNPYRAGHSALLEKILAESRAGKYPDVIGINFFQLAHLASIGLFEPYSPPEGKRIRKEFKDSQRHFTGFGINPFSLVYNTQAIPSAELPQSYDDLLDTKWKDRLGFVTQDVAWVVGIIDLMGKGKGEKFLKTLSKQNLHLRRGHSLQIQEVAAGAYDIGITSYSYLASRFHGIGAPVDFAYIKPVFTNYSGLGLVKKGRHKAAGKLLIRYLLSEEGQKMYRDTGRMPASQDVAPLDSRLTENVEFTPATEQWAAMYEDYAKFVQKVFLSK